MGLPIVNESYHADGRALWWTKKVKRQEVDVSSFTNTLTFFTSDDIITIYVPRGFQRAAPRPLILQHVKKAAVLGSLARNPALCDIQFRRSSFEDRYLKTNVNLHTLLSPRLRFRQDIGLWFQSWRKKVVP